MLILSTSVGSALGFLFWVLAARKYSADRVGIASALVSAMTFVSGVCELGLHAVLVRYIPAAGAATRRLIIGSYAVTGALTLIGAVAAAATSNHWSSALGFLSENGTWLVLFVGTTVAATIFMLQDSVLVGLRATHWVPIENVLFSIAKIVLLVMFASRAPGWGLFLAWGIPMVLTLLPVNWLIFRRLVPSRAHGSSNEAAFDHVKRFASANYVAMLLALASTTLLPIIVTNELGTTATAHFYVAWSIGAGLHLVASGTATAFTAEAASSEAMLRHYCRKTTAHSFRLLILPVALLVVLAPWVLRLFGREYARDATTLLRLLALVGLTSVINAIGQGVARVEHDRRTLVVTQVAQCVVTLVLTMLLLRPMGIGGVGVAVLAGQTVTAIGLMLGPLGPILLDRRTPSPDLPGSGSP